MHAARVSANGGIKYIDSDPRNDEERESGKEVSRIGEFQEMECAILTKIRRGGADATRTVSLGKGKTHFYSILGVLQRFDEEKNYKDQDDELYDMWERKWDVKWDVYSMVVGYYEKYPD